MANSNLIIESKNKIIKELVNDPFLVQVLNSKSADHNSPDTLINKNIFSFNQNPLTLKNTDTFITLQVHIPEVYRRSSTYINPNVEFWIVSHTSHMSIENIPKVSANRNDYLSVLIDKKFNGKSGFGIGKLTLVSNIELSFQQDYVGRKMVFEALDVNDSLCDDEE